MSHLYTRNHAGRNTVLISDANVMSRVIEEGTCPLGPYLVIKKVASCDHIVDVARRHPSELHVIDEPVSRLGFESAQIAGDVHRMLLKDLHRYQLESFFVGRGKNHGSRNAVVVSSQPIPSSDTPPVPRLQPGEAVLGHRGTEIVPDAPLMLEELSRNNGADRMAAHILGSRVAAPVTEEAGERVFTALLELSAEHVPFGHADSIVQAPPREKAP